jgi:hypothetical protein
MWFNPSDFKKSAEDPTAIFAIPAIPETQNSKTAKIAMPYLVIPEIENSKIAGIANRSESNNAALSVIVSALSGKILSVPDEDDRHHCYECMDLRNGYCFKQCFRPVDDMPRRCEDFNGYPNETARIGDDTAPEMVAKTKPAITCKTCMNFEGYHAHGGGAGICKAGVMPFGACWWGDTLHLCDKYQSSVSGQGEPEPDLTPEHEADRISEPEYNDQGLFYQFLITRQDGSQFHSYSMPRMTLAEARAQYPDAAAVESVFWKQ